MLTIDRELLQPEIRDISAEKVINLLNSFILTKKIQESSYEKGKKGEQTIEEIIKNNFVVEKKSEHCGDFIIHKPEYPEVKLIIEVKNYTRTVPEKEIEKFFSDIELNKLPGIFVSATRVVNWPMFEIKNNYAVVCGFENFAVIVELFYFKQLSFKKFKFLKAEKKIQALFKKIQNSVDSISEIKILMQNLGKNFNICQDRIYKICDKIKFETEIEVDKLSREMRGEKVEIVEDFYPDGIFAAKAKPIIQQFLDSYFNVKPIQAKLEGKTTKVEYSNGDKKIMFEFLKTKINIYFVPTNIDFVKFPNITVKNGLAKIELDEKSLHSEILKSI